MTLKSSKHLLQMNVRIYKSVDNEKPNQVKAQGMQLMCFIE